MDLIKNFTASPALKPVCCVVARSDYDRAKTLHELDLISGIIKEVGRVRAAELLSLNNACCGVSR